MVMRPAVSSIRSRQTVQVGSSIRLGVGGGKGRRLRVLLGEGRVSTGLPFPPALLVVVL